ncbi:MAG: ABC transporter permease subunit [Candidatus Coproplasma sp.]
MSNFKRLLKYEAVRIGTQKIWLFLLLGLIVAVALIFGIGYAQDDAHELGGFDKAAVMQEYEEHYLQYCRMIDEYGDTTSEEQLKNWEKQAALYRFYLDTDTTEYDYVNSFDYTFKYVGYENFGFCNYFFEMMTYVFCITAVICALWTFSAEQRTVKNLLAAPIKRKQIFAVKTGVTFFAAMLTPVFLFVALVITCACSPTRQFLIYTGRYVAVSGVHMFAQIGVRNLLVIAFFYFFTLLCTQYLKPLASALTPLFGFIFLELLGAILANKPLFYRLGSAAFNPFNFYPVMGLWGYLGGFDFHFIIIVVAYLLVEVGLLIWSGVRFNRKDF